VTQPIQLSAEKREEEARLCLDRKTQCESDIGFSEYVGRLRNWDIQWRGVIERENAPWDHASQYNPAVTFSRVEDVHALLFGAINNFNFFSLAASGRRDLSADVLRKRAQDWTDLLRWSLQNESNAISFLDRFVHDGLVYGSGYGYLPWLRDNRKIRSEFFVPDEIRSNRKLSDRSLIKRSLVGRIKGELSHKQSDDSHLTTFLDDDGEEKDARIWVDRENPYRPEGEPVLIIERDSLIYNAPRPRNLAPWEIVVPPNARDLQNTAHYWVIDHMTYDEVLSFRDRGIFNAISDDDMGMLEEHAKRTYPGLSPSSTIHDAVDEQRDAEFGLGKLTARTGQLEVIREYAFEDIDGDGYAESIVRFVTSYPKKHILLGRHRLEYLYPHGRRPEFSWHPFKLDYRYAGMGFPELLERAQLEANAFYQSRSDVLEIITKPGGMYDPMSGLAPEEIRYTPGVMVKARDPQRAFHPFAFSVDPGLLFREQSGIELQTERAIGSTDMGLGRGPTRPNAPRTLGGTALMVRQQQLRTNVYLTRLFYGSDEVSGGIQEFLLQYKEMYAALMPEEKEFRAIGTDELRKIQRSDLQGRFDFLIDFGEMQSNPQLQMQNATMRYQYSLNNPLIMQNPEAFWKITIDFLEATGMRNAARVLPSPSGGSHPPMSQDEEFNVLSKGIYVEPLPGDNHGEHLTKIMLLVQNEQQMAQMFSPSEVQLLERHAAKHIEMMNAAAMQQKSQGQIGPQGQAAMAGVRGPQETIASPIETEAGGMEQ